MSTVSETGAVGGKKITIEQFFAVEKKLKEKLENGEIDRDEFNDSYDRLKCLYEQSENDSDAGRLGVGRTIPQGLTEEQFVNSSKLIRQNVGNICDDIVVQGSRAGATAKATSDIDYAIRVSPEKFDDLIKQRFGTPNPGSGKERTMLHAIETGRIQAGEAGLRGLRKQLQEILGIDVDISIIKSGGSFDNEPMINIPK